MKSFREYIKESRKDVYSVRVGDGNKFKTLNISADSESDAKTKAIARFKKSSRGISGGSPKADNVKLVKKGSRLVDNLGNIK